MTPSTIGWLVVLSFLSWIVWLGLKSLPPIIARNEEHPEDRRP